MLKVWAKWIIAYHKTEQIVVYKEHNTGNRKGVQQKLSIYKYITIFIFVNNIMFYKQKNVPTRTACIYSFIVGVALFSERIFPKCQY